MKNNSLLTTGDIYYIFKNINEVGTMDEKFESIKTLIDIKYNGRVQSYHINVSEMWDVIRFLSRVLDERDKEISNLKKQLKDKSKGGMEGVPRKERNPRVS